MDDSRAAWLWAKFLASESEAEMVELAKENENIEQGRLILMELSEDEKAQWIADLEETGRRDWRASMKGAREEGLAEGEAKGLAEGKHDAARRMKADGMDAALIAKYTGLTPEEIAEL